MTLVSKSMVVAAAPSTAFKVFTAEMTRWPRTTSARQRRQGW